MSATTAERRRTPSLDGMLVAREMLMDGLSVDGRIVRGAEGSDIVRRRIGTRLGFGMEHPDLFGKPGTVAPRYELELEREAA